MRYLNAVSLLLVIIGGLNWLLVAIAKFDFVAAITGDTFGKKNPISTAIYSLVGLAALVQLPILFRWLGGRDPRD